MKVNLDDQCTPVIFLQAGGYTQAKSGDAVFISWSGAALVASDYANVLTTELRTVGFRYRASFSKLRKLTVTQVSNCLVTGYDRASQPTLFAMVKPKLLVTRHIGTKYSQCNFL